MELIGIHINLVIDNSWLSIQIKGFPSNGLVASRFDTQ